MLVIAADHAATNLLSRQESGQAEGQQQGRHTHGASAGGGAGVVARSGLAMRMSARTRPTPG